MATDRLVHCRLGRNGGRCFRGLQGWLNSWNERQCGLSTLDLLQSVLAIRPADASSPCSPHVACLPPALWKADCCPPSPARCSGVAKWMGPFARRRNNRLFSYHFQPPAQRARLVRLVRGFQGWLGSLLQLGALAESFQPHGHLPSWLFVLIKGGPGGQIRESCTPARRERSQKKVLAA